MPDINTILLPYPISANLYWRSRIFRGRVIVHLSPAADAYKQGAGWAAKKAGFEILTGPVSVSITLHPKMTKEGRASERIIDLDNAIKVTIDAMNGIAYKDDSQIVEIHAEVGDAMDGGGVSFSVACYHGMAKSCDALENINADLGERAAEFKKRLHQVWCGEFNAEARAVEALIAEREACARMLELRDSELLLMAGEMTAQELRTVKAVLAQRADAIRMRSNAEL